MKKVARRSLGVAGRRVAVALASLGGDAFQVSALAERLHGIFGQAAGLSPLPQGGPHVLPECAAQGFFRIDQRRILLQFDQLFVIHQRGSGVEFLRRQTV